MNATAETKYPISDALTLKEKKRVYVLWIEHMVRMGCSIDNYLSPNYSRINFDYLVSDLINKGQFLDAHFTRDFLAYEDWYNKVENKIQLI